jgi:decaprenyl-phosphate phosphoribosyltransferase
MTILSAIRLLRPHQYIKNLFIFLPLFFSLKFTEISLLLASVGAFMAFSLVASAVYIFNDYRDIEEDRRHPKKSLRPLASGEIGKRQGLLIMAGLMLAGLVLMGWLSPLATGVLLAYVVMNIAYSLHLKYVAILDVTIIAVGFVLRLFVGSAVTGVALSAWIIVMTFLLALFLALAKRRDDVLIYLDTGKKMRRVIDGYNLQFLDAAMAIMASVVIVAYVIYTTSPESLGAMHSQYLYLTALFVILGILRYMKITFVHQDSGSPTKIVFKDRFMQLTLLGWVLSFAWILY